MALKGSLEERNRDTARGRTEAGPSATPTSRADERETGARMEQERDVQTSRETGREAATNWRRTT